MGRSAAGFIILPAGHCWNEFTPLEYSISHWKESLPVTQYSYGELSQELYCLGLFGAGHLDLLERLSKETDTDVSSIDLSDQRLWETLQNPVKNKGKEAFKSAKGASFANIEEKVKTGLSSSVIQYLRLTYFQLNHPELYERIYRELFS